MHLGDPLIPENKKRSSPTPKNIRRTNPWNRHNHHPDETNLRHWARTTKPSFTTFNHEEPKKIEKEIDSLITLRADCYHKLAHWRPCHNARVSRINSWDEPFARRDTPEKNPKTRTTSILERALEIEQQQKKTIDLRVGRDLQWRHARSHATSRGREHCLTSFNF